MQEGEINFKELNIFSSLAYIRINLYPENINPIGFTSEVEKEFIREAVPHKLMILLVKPSNKV